MKQAVPALLVLCLLLVPTLGRADPATFPAAAVEEKPPPIRVVFGFSSRYFEEGGEGRVEIRRITPGGPAEKAGIRPGDVVTAVNGLEFRFEGEWDWMRSLGWAEAGVPIDFSLRRDGKPLVLALTPGAASAEHQRRFAEHLAKLERLHAEGQSGEQCEARSVVHPTEALYRQVLAAGGEAQFILAKGSGGALELHSRDLDVADYPIATDKVLMQFGKRLRDGEAVEIHMKVTEAPRLGAEISIVGEIFARARRSDD